MWLDSVRIGYRNLRKYPNQYRFVRLKPGKRAREDDA
jgi:hypothetical protein